MTGYKERTLQEFQSVLSMADGARSALDFGSGDGWYAAQLLERRCFDQIEAIDVKLRDVVHFTPTLYDGDGPLPYGDRSFDIAYAIDVLHHCPSPQDSLHELARVSDKYILIKDHTYQTRVGEYALAVLDELGNRRFGIPSPHNYQREWAWKSALESLGWSEVHRTWPARCHQGLLGALTNRLQYVSLFRRDPLSS